LIQIASRYISLTYLQRCVEITVAHQDIAASESDAIVCPAGTGLEMTSAVAQRLREESGGPVYSDLQRYDPVDSGAAVVTRGYDLTKYLIHAVTTAEENTRAQNVRAATVASLDHADTLACDEISIPVLGAGYGNLSIEASVKIIGETVSAYQPNQLSAAQIVCKSEIKYDRTKRLCSQNEVWVNRGL
jgi:O-acetyl-ADP-ribose deacetylase (regulator of RNase III)